MRHLLPVAAAGSLVVVLLAIPGPADAETAPPVQVVAAWGFDSVGADGQVADASGLGHGLDLAGSYALVPGSAATSAVQFAVPSYGVVAMPAPGTADLAVTVVLRSTAGKPFKDSPNVVQDGLYADPSQVKVQLSKAGKSKLQCRFKGSSGAILLHGPSIVVNDGGWHTVTCWREGSTVGATVDGVTTSVLFDVGEITPIRSMTVAGRGVLPGDLSDQFVGDLDAVVWATGAGARDAAQSYATALVTDGAASPP